VCLVRFGLFEPIKPSKVQMDATGRQRRADSWRGDKKKNADHARHEVPHRTDFKFAGCDASRAVREFPEYPVVLMTTLWPKPYIRRPSNTLAICAIVKAWHAGVVRASRGPYLGYADDDVDMTHEPAGWQGRGRTSWGPGGRDSSDRRQRDNEMSIRAGGSATS